jgi:hypothetical protein
MTLSGGHQAPFPTVSVGGVCHNFPITPAATDVERIVTTEAGRVHDADLILGMNEAGGPVRIHYLTAAQYRAAALAMNRCADWIEAGDQAAIPVAVAATMAGIVGA